MEKRKLAKVSGDNIPDVASLEPAPKEKHVVLVKPKADKVDPVSVARALLAKRSEENVGDGLKEFDALVKRRKLTIGIRQISSNIPGEQPVRYEIVFYPQAEE